MGKQGAYTVYKTMSKILLNPNKIAILDKKLKAVTKNFFEKSSKKQAARNILWEIKINCG